MTCDDISYVQVCHDYDFMISNLTQILLSPFDTTNCCLSRISSCSSSSTPTYTCIQGCRITGYCFVGYRCTSLLQYIGPGPPRYISCSVRFVLRTYIHIPNITHFVFNTMSTKGVPCITQSFQVQCTTFQVLCIFVFAHDILLLYLAYSSTC